MADDYASEMKRLAARFFTAELSRQGLAELIDEDGRPTMEAKRNIRRSIVLAQAFMGEVARSTRA